MIIHPALYFIWYLIYPYFAHFQLKDIIQFNITGAILKSNIKPMYESLIDKQVLSQYKSKLASLSTGQVKAAIIGAQGLSMRSGNTLIFSQRDYMTQFFYKTY